ncbi:MAG: ABC transporter ATP-binding protein [Deltaproteobacteria bacterium]|nr:ABC transporter ATP-binding protein [Deltaproteobacteria bacterium]
MLTIQHLCKRFGDYDALSDISFDVIQGEILGLIGPNGSGKTTLMESLAGLLHADGGTVSRQGKALPAGRRKDILFYLPDNVLPYGDQHVITILDFFCAMFRTGHDIKDGVIRALALTPVLTKRIHTLSKGYRRRFLLAIALLSPQPLLVLDEPFDGFDLHQTRGVMSHLRDVRTTGRTLLLSIHQLTDAERICDRFVLLSSGRLIGNGNLPELRKQAGLETGNLEEVFLALTRPNI